MKFSNWLKMEIHHQFIRSFIFPKIYKIGKQFKVASVEQTIFSLIHSHRSLSRFGDGELGWLYDKDILPTNIFSFEHKSNNLQEALINVLRSSNSNLEIGLSPLNEVYSYHYKSKCKRALKLFMSKLGPSWMNYLNCNKQYYNTNITRGFSGYRSYNYSKYIFTQLKRIWKHKHILIVEGKGTRLGINDDLLNTATTIKRIECPITNAFESYNLILNNVTDYLNNNTNINMTLISLGPTATVLASDLCDKGFRAIDVGHVDIEYEWFLRKKVCDIPYKFVNEVRGGQKISPIHNKEYEREIVNQL